MRIWSPTESVTPISEIPPPCRLCLFGGVGGGLDGGCGGMANPPNEHGPPSFHGHDSADVTISAVGATGWSRNVELTARWHFRGTLFGYRMRNLEEVLQ